MWKIKRNEWRNANASSVTSPVWVALLPLITFVMYLQPHSSGLAVLCVSLSIPSPYLSLPLLVISVAIITVRVQWGYFGDEFSSGQASPTCREERLLAWRCCCVWGSVCACVCVWPQQDVRTPPDAACGTYRKLRYHHWAASHWDTTDLIHHHHHHHSHFSKSPPPGNRNPAVTLDASHVSVWSQCLHARRSAVVEWSVAAAGDPTCCSQWRCRCLVVHDGW